MKRLFILMLALISFGVGNAQINSNKSMEHKEQKYNLDKYEFYLDRSTKFQAGAVGSAAVAAGCFIGYACQKEKFEYKDNNRNELKMKDMPKYLLIGGGIAAAAAVAFELVAINYKLESGNHLKLFLTGNGANLSFNF